MKIVNYYFGINLIWINFYMDKVLSWKDLGITITKVPGDTDNRCPSYGRVKSVNSASTINKIIVWPSGRKDTQLILNSYFNTQEYWKLKFKNIDESVTGCIIDINQELSIDIESTYYKNGIGMTSSTTLHYRITEDNRILYDDTGKLYNSSFMKCYEQGGDSLGTASDHNTFNLTFKSHYNEIHFEVWVEGHEETKKMIRLVDMYAGDI